MQLLVIAGHDLTQHIKVPSWNVNCDDVYEEWTDANYVKHREVTRTRVSGSFTLLYDDNNQLDQFFDIIQAQKALDTSKAVKMTVYMNNLCTTKEIDAFVKFTAANERPYFGREKVSGFSVSIEEK